MHPRVWTLLVVCLTARVLDSSMAAQGRHAVDPVGREGATAGVESRSTSPPAERVDGARGTSLGELVELALAGNAELLATRQRIAEARGVFRQAGLRPNPALEADLSNGPVLGSPGERELSVGYNHVFELGGKRGRRIDVAQRGLELAQVEVADREREVTAAVKARYADALAAQRNLEIASRLLELTGNGYRLIQSRVSQGDAARLDQGLLRVEVGRLASDRLLFESQAERAILELKTLAGLDLEAPLHLDDNWDTAPPALSLEQATERAVVGRPDLIAARREADLRETEVRLAEVEAVPDLVGSVRYTRISSRFDQFAVTAGGSLAPIRDTDHLLTAGISIVLPLRNRNQGNVEAARARREAARLRRQFLEQVVRREVRAAYGRYEAARRAVEIFDREATTQSRENLEVVRASYSLGEARPLDLINEQRRLIDVQRAYTDVLKERYLTHVELERAVGAPVR